MFNVCIPPYQNSLVAVQDTSCVTGIYFNPPISREVLVAGVAMTSSQQLRKSAFVRSSYG